MSNETRQPSTPESASSAPSSGDPLTDDLEVDPEAAEQIKGGLKFLCSACAHTHNQGDIKCNSMCTHGGTSGGFY